MRIAHIEAAVDAILLSVILITFISGLAVVLLKDWLRKVKSRKDKASGRLPKRVRIPIRHLPPLFFLVLVGVALAAFPFIPQHPARLPRNRPEPTVWGLPWWAIGGS